MMEVIKFISAYRLGRPMELYRLESVEMENAGVEIEGKNL